MSARTFKEFLIEGPKKEVEGTGIFDAHNFLPKMNKVLDMMLKKTAIDGDMGNELTLLEMLSIIKEVLVSRLEPYLEDPEYKERKADDTKATIQSIEEEIKEILKLHYPEDGMRSIRNSFMALIVGPILDEATEAGLPATAASLDPNKFNEKAKDSFGKLMKYVISSEIIPNAEDAQVAQRVLAKWGAQSRKKRNFDKMTVAQQKQKRLDIIKQAVERIQGPEDTDF